MISISPKILAPVLVTVFVVGIGGSMIMGYWATESSKIPATITTGEFAGEYNPGDIRGSYSFADIESAFGVPVSALAQAFAIGGDADPGAFRANELETLYSVQPDGGEVGTDAVRFFTSLYTGIPYQPEDTTRLPTPAVGLLEDRLSPADLEQLVTRTVTPGLLRDSSSESAIEHTETDRVVKGKTTFDDLLSWGLTREQIEESLGMPMGSRSVAVRDYLSEQGVEFSTYRTKLQELLE